MVFLERTREGHHQWEVHSHCFKGNIGETFQRFGGSHVLYIYIYTFFKCIHTMPFLNTTTRFLPPTVR